MIKALLTKEDVRLFIIEAMKRDRILTRLELMAYFNMSPYLLKQYLKKGLPWFGKKTRKQFILSDVEKWLVNNGKIFRP